MRAQLITKSQKIIQLQINPSNKFLSSKLYIFEALQMVLTSLLLIKKGT